MPRATDRQRRTARRTICFGLPGLEIGRRDCLSPLFSGRRRTLAHVRRETETVRVWLVERTYSDDEQNLIILTYATTDGDRYFRKERALTSFTDARETTAAVDAAPENLGTVGDHDRRTQYADEARRMASVHDPDDVI